jgi:hypothetical protein
MNTAREVAPQIGIAAACLGLGVAPITSVKRDLKGEVLTILGKCVVPL